MDAVLAALTREIQSNRGPQAAGSHDAGPAASEVKDGLALLQVVLDQLPEGITLAFGPPEAPVVASSRPLEALIGVPRREILGSLAGPQTDGLGLFLSDGITRPRLDEVPLYRALRFGQTVRNAEFIAVRPDGTRVDVLVDANPIQAPGGRILGAISCWRDVTDMKRVQHALQALEAQLRDADLRKDEFLGMLAHELRGPLSPIRSAVHVLKVMDPGQPRLREIADILERQVQAMTRLLDDLLDLSRVTRGKLGLNVERMELRSAIDQAVEWNRAIVEAKRQHLTVAQPGEPVVVLGDAVRLAQVVSNLLGNAAKFTDAGGFIWITTEAAGHEAIVRVRDTGPGLVASELDNIFDLFYQLERTADRAGRGLGIGLSLVRRLVEMHGGRVEVSSDGPGRGSEFTVRLPLA